MVNLFSWVFLGVNLQIQELRAAKMTLKRLTACVARGGYYEQHVTEREKEPDRTNEDEDDDHQSRMFVVSVMILRVPTNHTPKRTTQVFLYERLN